MATAAKHSFVDFEFDAEVLTLWQSITTESIKTFAYQKKLRALINEAQTPWQTNLDSLKVLDALLSAIKSDFNQKNIQESQALAHKEFIKLLAVLALHTVKVLEQELSSVLSDGKIKLYAAQGFGRLYAHALTHIDAAALTLDDEQLDDFYQDLVVFAVGSRHTQEVAQSFFVLSVIGTRLFGSIERRIVGLDTQGMPQKHPSEDSLYWAVSDFLQSIKTTPNSQAKLLLQNRLEVATPKTDAIQAVTSSPKTIFDELEQTYLSDLPKQQAAIPTNPIVTPVQKPVVKTNPSHLAPSQYKKKARASHTPKLFAEAYQDLVDMSLPSDSNESYQQAAKVLTQFDNYINEALSKGQTLEQIHFNDTQKNARKTALQQLIVLIKNHNHSGAMLRMALYCFEGRGMAQDTKKALALVTQAANMQDARAQKLLSRLYYQGFEVGNDVIKADPQMGEYWLKKAADNGHEDAKKVCAYINQVQILKDDYQAQANLDKRYGIMLMVVAVIVVLVLLLINRFF